MVNISNVHIGVDISKNSLDIYLHPVKTLLKIDNSKVAIVKFIKDLSQHDVAQIACESTGGYEKLLASLLKKNGYDLWIIDPRRIKGFIKHDQKTPWLSKPGDEWSSYE